MGRAFGFNRTALGLLGLWGPSLLFPLFSPTHSNVFKDRTEGFLSGIGGVLQVILLGRGLEWMIFRGPFLPRPFCHSMSLSEKQRKRSKQKSPRTTKTLLVPFPARCQCPTISANCSVGYLGLLPLWSHCLPKTQRVFPASRPGSSGERVMLVLMTTCAWFLEGDVWQALCLRVPKGVVRSPQEEQNTNP